ncbi:hypothetical protein AAY473_009761 [Plecturocebus cupreus]
MSWSVSSKNLSTESLLCHPAGMQSCNRGSLQPPPPKCKSSSYLCLLEETTDKGFPERENR